MGVGWVSILKKGENMPLKRFVLVGVAIVITVSQVGFGFASSQNSPKGEVSRPCGMRAIGHKRAFR